MEQNDNIIQVKEFSFQDYLTMGYIYLILIGVVHDMIYFGFMGINIIQYSNIMDILLSPIALLADESYILITISIIMIILFWIANYGSNFHQNNRNKKWYSKLFNVEKLDKGYSEKKMINDLLQLTALSIFFFITGTGLGSGKRNSERLEEGKLKMDHTIRFTNNDSLNVKIMGQNSEYIFYVIEKGNSITVSPIQENIKQIDILSAKTKE